MQYCRDRGGRPLPRDSLRRVAGCCCRANPKSRIPNPEPRTPNPESRIPNPGSRIPNPESRIPNPESRIPDPEPRTPNPKPRIPNPESRTPNPESRIPNPVAGANLLAAVAPPLCTYNSPRGSALSLSKCFERRFAEVTPPTNQSTYLFLLLIPRIS